MPNPKKKKKPLVYPVVFMVAITMVFTTGLATLNAATTDRIKTQEAIKNQTSLLYVFDQTVPDGIEAIGAQYDALITQKGSGDSRYYEAYVDDTLVGYAFPFSGSGLWGTIWGYIALTPDLSQVMGVDFIKHSETPGLGGRISEQWYRDQFRGITLSDSAAPIVYRPSDGGNVDSITGATLTSQAVRNMINDALAHIRSAWKGDI
jgi:Na+-transporting NADH:ubiquinone oxidoreductase subunit C